MSKIDLLKKRIRGYGKMVIAYSGGVDSTFLVAVSKEVLGPRNILAVTASSESFPERELTFSRSMAKQIGVQQQIITTDEMKDKRFARNPKERCYFCKKELFKKIIHIARKHKTKVVADGANFDDAHDMRFGMRASKELGVFSPLLESGLTKNDIRKYSKIMKLKTSQKPSFACLASRIPYGEKITRKKLARIDRGEQYLFSLGYRQFRLRDHRDIARIEIERNDLVRFMRKDAKRVAEMLKKLGFKFITIDLEGYRMGSMNPQ